jgi:6-pyruvoyl-tetrahydropterin synthase
MHGHNYRVVVSVETFTLHEEKGWIFDFGVLKEIGKQIIGPLDHMYIAADANMHYIKVADARHTVRLNIPQSTAECLAKFMWDAFSTDIKTAYPDMEFFVLEVQVWETRKSMASFKSEVSNTERHGRLPEKQ